MRTSFREAAIVCLALSGSVFAQESASIVPFTLEISRTTAGFSKKENDELTRELPRALRAAKVNIPTTAVTENAMVALKRQDCDRDDGCLQQLAQKAETLYAMYISVDYNLDKNVVAAGRVVGDDGNVVRRQQTVTMPKGSRGFSAVAKEAIARLINELELSKLPATRAVVAVTPPIVSDVPVVGPKTGAVDPIPPPPMVEAQHAGISRTAAYVIMGSGLAAVVGGGVILLTAPQVQMEGSNVYAPDAQKVGGTNLQRAVGWPVLSLGVAAVAAGAILWGLSSESGTTVSAVPLPGGGVVSVGGTFQ